MRVVAARIASGVGEVRRGLAEAVEELQPLFAQAQGVAFARRISFGDDALGRLGDDGQHAGRRAAVVGHGRVVQVQPDLLRAAVGMEGQLLIAVGQGAAGQAHAQDLVVEGGELGPAFTHLAGEQARVTSPRQDGVRVVVEHHPVGAPEQGHWRL
jgi:hypothetical protein